MTVVTNSHNELETETSTKNVDLSMYEPKKKSIVVSYKTYCRIIQRMSYRDTFEDAITELLDIADGIRDNPEGA